MASDAPSVNVHSSGAIEPGRVRRNARSRVLGGVYRSRPSIEVAASAVLQEVVCSVRTSAGESWLFSGLPPAKDAGAAVEVCKVKKQTKLARSVSAPLLTSSTSIVTAALKHVSLLL